MSIAVNVPTPLGAPEGYEWFDDEPVFDPERHLALTEPESVVMLADLGYSASEIATKATPMAASAPFRMLSDEGAEVMLTVARRLRSYARPAGDRIARVVRGGTFRSRWLHDLCVSPEVTQHLSRIYGIEVMPHLISTQLAHLNYDPPSLDSIDKWHHDTLPLDYVMSVTDPAKVSGGRFEFFQGTKAEAAELAARGERPPAERTIVPNVPGPGWTIALHGDMVVHRAAPLTQLCERISMVNGYVATDATLDEQSRNADLKLIDDPGILYTDWARLSAWRARERLDNLLANLQYGVSREDAAASLRAAVADVEKAATEMLTEASMPEHYERR